MAATAIESAHQVTSKTRYNSVIQLRRPPMTVQRPPTNSKLGNDSNNNKKKLGNTVESGPKTNKDGRQCVSKK